MCSRVSRVLRALVPHVSCALRVLGLLVPRTIRALVLLVPHLLQVFQALHALMHLLPCSFHALCLLYFRCFRYLNFLQSRLRLINVIDSNKDTLNINDINTLYPLRVATYVKNGLQNLQTGFTSNRRVFTMFKFEVKSLKVEEVIVMIACSKSSELFYCNTKSILFCLKTSTLIQSDLIICFN